MLRRIRQPRAERLASGQTLRCERLQAARTLQAGARAPEKFKAETITGAVNVRQGETTVANEDGRLPHTDKVNAYRRVRRQRRERARGCDRGG
jgi:hypothetical protein